ncbi:MAG: flagellar hook-length control protein FliK, partial [Methylobacter sp.]
MDISSLISGPNLLGLAKPSENPLNLKVGQQLDVKVINADIQAAKNAVTLSIAGKEVTVQSSQPIALNRGQDLKIQVTQLTPTTEFKFVEPPPGQRDQAVEPRLKLIQVAKDAVQENARQSPASSDAKSAATGKEIMQQAGKDARAAANPEQMRTTIKDTSTAPVNKEPTAKDSGNAAIARQLTPETAGATTSKQPTPTSANTARPTVGDKPESPAPSLPVKQLLDAKIAGVDGNKIQLQFSGTDNKPALMVTIDRAQLSNAPAELKPGQNLNLEMVKTGTVPEFKVVNPATYIPEAKVAEFVKQFLPRHEAAPVLLNQLIKDLPQIVKNPNVPQALKDLAANIVQNLPPKEQLTTGQGLKQSIVNSGLFLEAKLLPAASQMELLKQLPQLIQNETVPQSLQRIAAEILQNLTQKQPLPDSPEPEPAAHAAKPEAEPAAAKTPVPDAPKTTAQQAPVAEDFKANLLKFIQALKQEITSQDQQPANPAELDLLKNLQHKSENTVAKLVLDQLA